MTQVESFVFSPFAENTYVLHDETKECVIIDPGCYSPAEENELVKLIDSLTLKPVKLLNTHCHIDHVFGNKFIAEKYDLTLETHKGEIPVLEALPQYSQLFGVESAPSPSPGVLLEEGDTIRFGNTELEVLFTPGHSPASISFYNRRDGFIIAGDVLFKGSIGRTDLPGGDLNILMESISEKLYKLDDSVIVYNGHGPETTIGAEKATNPFVRAYLEGQRW